MELSPRVESRGRPARRLSLRVHPHPDSTYIIARRRFQTPDSRLPKGRVRRCRSSFVWTSSGLGLEAHSGFRPQDSGLFRIQHGLGWDGTGLDRNMEATASRAGTSSRCGQQGLVPTPELGSEQAAEVVARFCAVLCGAVRGRGARRGDARVVAEEEEEAGPRIRLALPPASEYAVTPRGRVRSYRPRPTPESRVGCCVPGASRHGRAPVLVVRVGGRRKEEGGRRKGKAERRASRDAVGAPSRTTGVGPSRHGVPRHEPPLLPASTAPGSIAPIALIARPRPPSLARREWVHSIRLGQHAQLRPRPRPRPLSLSLSRPTLRLRQTSASASVLPTQMTARHFYRAG
ncbi:hypothetical protein B0H15DRAFT_291909 [Mycena belliarum]|uniref:Uncharacterized protein n=1 Tax=Mycena belliarum TaxID=1033014 RepID=A0AAD6XUJ6_9AGAR|nr:hypothetical protein B0H15DRAFT_291909 [Mycena belliae]